MVAKIFRTNSINKNSFFLKLELCSFNLWKNRYEANTTNEKKIQNHFVLDIEDYYFDLEEK